MLYTAIVEGLTATIIGMGIVFGVLALLAFILSFFKLLNKEQPSRQNDEAPPDTMLDNYNEAQALEPDGGQMKEELVAVISAALAEFMSGSSYKIKTIKPVKNISTPWSIAAKRENQRGIKY